MSLQPLTKTELLMMEAKWLAELRTDANGMADYAGRALEVIQSELKQEELYEQRRSRERTSDEKAPDIRSNS